MKATIPGKVAFFMAQVLIGKFLNSATVLADHESVASYIVAQSAPYKSASG